MLTDREIEVVKAKVVAAVRRGERVLTLGSREERACAMQMLSDMRQAGLNFPFVTVNRRVEVSNDILDNFQYVPRTTN